MFEVFFKPHIGRSQQYVGLLSELFFTISNYYEGCVLGLMVTMKGFGQEANGTDLIVGANFLLQLDYSYIIVIHVSLVVGVTYNILHSDSLHVVGVATQIVRAQSDLK